MLARESKEYLAIIVNAISMLKNLSRSQAVTYAVKVVVSGKRSKIMLLKHEQEVN